MEHTRIDGASASVAVVGQGYVGLSVGLAAAAAGFTVFGIDRDHDRIQELARGRLVVPGVDDGAFAEGVETGRLSFTTDVAVVADADVVLICVPTPVREHRPDLDAVEAAARAVAPHLRRGALVVLESTTYPGTTTQILQPLLEAGGLRAGPDFHLAYSPERIDPGNDKFGFADVPRVVGGIDQRSTRLATAFYGQLVHHVHPVSNCQAAEMAKLLENTYRMVNIALVNELATLCADQGLDAWEVIAAAASKPFGFTPFYPGPGVGGHCIPVDPTYLTWQSRRDAGKPFRLVELAQDINTEMPRYVASRIGDALNDVGKAVRGAVILALGVTYKPDVGDIRESAAIRVLELLAGKGAAIRFHDPFIRRLDAGPLAVDGEELGDGLFDGVDLVALLTPHRDYDLPWVVERAPLLFDARNATGRRDLPHVVVL